MIKNIFKEPIREAQALLNKEYAEKGFTNEILESQVELYTIRHTLDIHDENEEIYEEYVQ